MWCINCSRNAAYSFHSAGLYISDVTIHWYCDHRTETARTTHPRLAVSAVPQFQTVIASDSAAPRTAKSTRFNQVCWPHRTQARQMWLFALRVFDVGYSIWQCETARCNAAEACCLNNQLCPHSEYYYRYLIFNRTICHNLSLMFTKNYYIRSKHLTDTSKNVIWPHFWPIGCIRWNVHEVLQYNTKTIKWNQNAMYSTTSCHETYPKNVSTQYTQFLISITVML